MREKIRVFENDLQGFVVSAEQLQEKFWLSVAQSWFFRKKIFVGYSNPTILLEIADDDENQFWENLHTGVSF